MDGIREVHLSRSEEVPVPVTIEETAFLGPIGGDKSLDFISETVARTKLLT